MVVYMVKSGSALRFGQVGFIKKENPLGKRWMKRSKRHKDC
jgi:hypothetical protein